MDAQLVSFCCAWLCRKEGVALRNNGARGWRKHTNFRSQHRLTFSLWFANTDCSTRFLANLLLSSIFRFQELELEQ